MQSIPKILTSQFISTKNKEKPMKDVIKSKESIKTIVSKKTNTEIMKRMNSVYKTSSKNVKFTQLDQKLNHSRERLDSMQEYESDSLSHSSRQQKPIDGRCPKCKLLLDLPTTTIF